MGEICAAACDPADDACVTACDDGRLRCRGDCRATCEADYPDLCVDPDFVLRVVSPLGLWLDRQGNLAANDAIRAAGFLLD